MRILFIPDSRGQGHKVRCAALAKELWDRGHETDIIGTLDVAIDQRRGYQAVVIDVKNDIPMGSAIKHTIRIIDDPEGQKGACDLMFLGCAANAYGYVTGDSPQPPFCLSGPKYSLLRPEFRLAREVTMETRAGILDIRQSSDYTAMQLSIMLSMAKVVVTYGGMRAMEAACCGAPMVVVPRNRGEALNVRGLVDAGAAIISTESEAARIAKELSGAENLLAQMSRDGRKLVDGLGCERVADEIERLCQ